MNNHGKFALAAIAFALLVVAFAFISVTPQAKAGGVPPGGSTGGLLTSTFLGTDVGLLKEPRLSLKHNVVVDCVLPSPAPACTAGQTICIEGSRCQAVQATCAGTPGTWGTPTRCPLNACNRNPGSIGSTCQ